MEMGGSSNAVDASAPTQDLKFMQASNINVSNFVTVKLSGINNYHIWKAQMVCLIESQALLHIIRDDLFQFPEDKGVRMIWYYDRLVKGWIFGSIDEQLLKYFLFSCSAAEVWKRLEMVFNVPMLNAEGYPWNAFDVTAPTQDLKFMQASNINVSNFVTVKLRGCSNYNIWRAQMLCLIESQALVHIIYDGYPFPLDKGVNMIWHYDRLVKGWIFGSMDEQFIREYLHFDSARAVWMKIESTFDGPSPTHNRELDERGYDSTYMKASNINVSCFVSVKLSGQSNFAVWKAQMLCLLISQRLQNIVLEGPYTERIYPFDTLVKGWILGSVDEKLISPDSVSFSSARELWKELESLFEPLEHQEVESVGFIFRTEPVRDFPEIENTDNIRLKKELYEAAVEGCWWKAKSILNTHNNLATEAIYENGNTILHVAVEMGHNYFVEKLLDFLKDENDVETQNSDGGTALHIAVMSNNEYASQLLVQKRKELLTIQDQHRESPLDMAFDNKKLNISTYLMKSVLSSEAISSQLGDNTIQDAMYAAIFTKQYDLAEALYKKFPDFDWNFEKILFAITITFPNDLGIFESFIYPSFHNVYQKTIMRGSMLFHSKFWDKYVDEILQAVKICNNMGYRWLEEISMILLVPIATRYPIYQLICLLVLVLHLTFSMLYFVLWKVLAFTVTPIKYIEKKKKEYKEANIMLSLTCSKIDTLIDSSSEPRDSYNDHYRRSIVEAVRQGSFEVVDKILYASPTAINCMDEEGHNVIQLAVLNRSEKVYNLIYHIIERTEYYRRMKDAHSNNLAHLAGRLAPSFVLDRTTGAALQLQRELLWREEVEKLMLPLELRDKNISMETPKMLFSREHKDLMKQGENWIKTTAESCSITAALIITIVFASSITVPGGSNQESGIPIFNKEIAFTIFAVFNALSLFTTTSSLLLFLSILTARFSERDFLTSLPRRLILGLLMLFLSTTTMIVASGAILLLVFCDQRPWMLAPICGLACLPISIIVTIKLPLLVDLVQSTYFPIFGKQSYLESCRVNRKNTIFIVDGRCGTEDMLENLAT